MKHKGFTLTELMVAVAVVAILAAIAIPQYQKTVRRAHRQTAEDILRTIYAGEHVYKSVNKVFISLDDASDWRDIFMDNPNRATNVLPVTFGVVANLGPPPTFTATATYTPTGATMTINQDNTLTGGVW